MTARVVPFERPTRSGRQPAAVEQTRDLHDELTALIAEDLDHGRELLAVTRTAMVAVAAGRSPADHLVALEDRILRLILQRKGASAALAAQDVCPDGAETRHLGHGRAA